MFDFFLNPAPAAHKPAAAQFKQTEARDHHQAGAGPTARAVGVQRCPQEAQHRPERSIELQVVGHLHHPRHPPPPPAPPPPPPPPAPPPPPRGAGAPVGAACQPRPAGGSL